MKKFLSQCVKCFPSDKEENQPSNIIQKQINQQIIIQIYQENQNETNQEDNEHIAQFQSEINNEEKQNQIQISKHLNNDPCEEESPDQEDNNNGISQNNVEKEKKKKAFVQPSNLMLSKLKRYQDLVRSPIQEKPENEEQTPLNPNLNSKFSLQRKIDLSTMSVSSSQKKVANEKLAKQKKHSDKSKEHEESKKKRKKGKNKTKKEFKESVISQNNTQDVQSN